MGAFNDVAVPRAGVHEVEVVAKASRRRFPAEYKRRILREADTCTAPGAIGALLRREGLYSSHLTTWRAQRARGELAGLTPKQRGPAPKAKNPLAAKVATLEREVSRQTARAERAEALVELQKKSGGAPGDPAPTNRREALMPLITEHSVILGVAPVCQALAVPRATYYRWHQPKPRGPARPRRAPRALPPEERQQILAVLNDDRFADLAPAEVYATLLDEGKYLCSIRTMYRVLKANAQVHERRRQLRHPRAAAPELLATGPNQLWSWDITTLKGPAKWTAFYLYVILDVFSRYVVGWLAALRESATLAQRLIEQTCARQGIAQGELTIHADRGSAMISRSVALLLADLGVSKTHNRPHVSNDNPFSESQFKTLKYHPEFPDRFGSLQDARSFLLDFFLWYNTMHHHSALGWLTPHDVHYGLAATRLAEREAALRQAFAATPERFVRGLPTPPALPQAVWINKPRTLDEHDEALGAVEPGERVARPTGWCSALAGRTLDGEVSPSAPANATELGLAVVH